MHPFSLKVFSQGTVKLCSQWWTVRAFKALSAGLKNLKHKLIIIIIIINYILFVNLFIK